MDNNTVLNISLWTCWILENVMHRLVMSSPSLLTLCVFIPPAEYLALCPNGGGITGDGRGREQKLIIRVKIWLKM